MEEDFVFRLRSEGRDLVDCPGVRGSLTDRRGRGRRWCGGGTTRSGER